MSSSEPTCPNCNADLVKERVGGAIFGRGVDLQCDDPVNGGKMGYATQCPDCGHIWPRFETIRLFETIALAGAG